MKVSLVGPWLVEKLFFSYSVFAKALKILQQQVKQYSNQPETKELSKSADEVFAMVGLKCKTWNYSGEPPSEKSTKDGVSIGVAGFKWFTDCEFVFTLTSSHLFDRE